MKYFVDTNIFLRFLVGDVKTQAKESRKFFDFALDDEEISLYTSEAVIMEIVWTLGSYYDLSKSEISNEIGPILEFMNFIYPEGDFDWKLIIKPYLEGVSFVDSFNYQLCEKEGIEVVVSFDQDFDSLDIKRRRPSDIF